MDEFSTASQAGFQWATTVPWLLIGLAILPLAVIALATGIFPSQRWVVLLSIVVALCVITVFVTAMLIAVLVLDGLIVIFAAVDFLILWVSTRQGIGVRREVARTCSIGVPLTSELSVTNRTPLTLVGSVTDDLPEDFDADPGEHELRLSPLSEITTQRTLRPVRRGAFELHHVYFRLTSPLRLWNRQLRMDLHDQISVYPDMKQMADYALLARTNRLSLIGVRRTRRIGQDSDFERLRDYTRDDNYRHIDWRSTARRHKLTVKQFQTDQSQRIVLMLDCGRMMTNERNGLSLLDHALNASLMMAYVALHQGDAVGMLCFSDQVHSFLPPRGGSSQMNRLIQAGFDQFPRMVESRYDQAFLYLSNHCKRRSLVTLMTNLVDEVNAAAVVDYLGNLSGHHLPLGVLLRDRVLFDAADAPQAIPAMASEADTFGQHSQTLYRAAAAADILIWRNQVIRDLQHRGVLCVDAFPDDLTAPLINQYLEIKAKHLL